MARSVPLFINSSLYGLNFVDASPAQIYTDPKIYVEGQLGFQEKYPTDMVPCPVYLVGESLQYGSVVKVQNETAPILKKTYYEGSGKMPLAIPNFSSPFYDYFFETVALMKKEMPDKYLLAFVTSPVDYGIMVFGTIKWLDMLLFERELYDYWLHAFTVYHNKFKEILVGMGVDRLITSNVFMNNRIIPDKLIGGHIIPKLNEWIDPSYPTIIHATFMPVLECVKRLESLDSSWGYVLDESDDLSEVVDYLSKPKIIAGNLGSEYIYKKTPATIEKMVYKALTSMKRYDKYVLSTSGADMNLKTSNEQLLSIYRGIERYEADN